MYDIVLETSEPSEIAAALKVERKHLSRDVSVTKERHADCPQPEPGIFAMLSSVLWGRPADRATTREASSPPESPRLKAPLCAEHIVKRGRQPTTVAQKGMKTVPISVSGEKETPPANDLICADTCWQSHLHGAPEPQPSTLHYASDRGDALFTQNNRCRVSTSNSMSMGAGSWSGSGTGEDNGKVEENPSPLRPNVLQSLQDLTAETDKFTLCMGALNMGSPAELAPPAPDETATATTTVPPIDPSALRTVATDLHVSFYELVHQLVLLCEEVHSYNVYLERIKRTRELLNARYMSLPRVSLMACYIYSNATYAYREAKKAELDAHQADLMAREAALSGMWDDLHNRCYQWNGAAHHFNSAWGQVNDECIRWNTGLTLVGDTIPLPELYMSDSVSHFSPGLFLFAAKDTLVVPFNRGKVCDYWFIVWNHFRRITGTYR